MDVDLQDPPEALSGMLTKWREGFEVVYGVRRNREHDSIPKRLTADFFYRVHNWLSTDKIPEHAGDFRLLDRKVVDVIRALPERNRFMKGLFAWAGFRQAAVFYSRQARQAGTSKFGYWKLWTFALAWAAFITVRTLVLGIDLPGYASIIVAVLFLGGLQLLSLGIIGEYVGRILVEAKQRPVYVVRENVGE
jgi:glycosyltransferase involved in cell wall biosynthesis